MLFVALVTCLIALVLCTLVVRSAQQTITLLEALVVAAILLLLAALTSSYAIYYALLLIPPMVLWTAMRWRARTFATVASLLLAGMFGWDLVKAWQQVVHLREVHPFISLEDRLPPPKPRSAPVLSELAQAHVELVSDTYDESFRSTVLRELHEDATRFFVNSPSFGVKRMRPPSHYLHENDYNKNERCQPMPFDPMKGTIREVLNLPLPADQLDFDGLIYRPLLAFAPPGSEGYVRSRREVAGFIPHGRQDYLKSATPPPTLHVLRLDLVSLLLHDPAVVYDTDSLPNMDQVKELKTRPLDAFEQAALADLRQGNELFARELTSHIRILGALRNAKTCMKCHDGAEGELLGALSYTLERRNTPK
jgi:hypothetical protein